MGFRVAGAARSRVSAGGLDALRGRTIAQLIESDGPGGAERLLAELAAGLVRRGCRCVAFVPARGEGWLERKLEATGVEVERFHLDRPLSRACAVELAAAFARHGVELAHSHEFSMGVYGAWAARRAGVPHLFTMHGSRYYAQRLRRRLALRLAAFGSGGVVAVSHPLADHLRKDLLLARDRVAVIPNGVPHAEVPAAPIRQELGLGPRDRLILAVGNLYPVKGHRYLIEALAALRRRHPEAHVAIAGRGTEEAALTALAAALGLKDRVHLLGLRDDVRALLAAADVFAMPSLSEGLPMALLEAMFTARPIVASDVGEIRSALGGGRAGLLVPPGDSAALASALAKLLEDGASVRALGARAATRAAAEYDLERTIDRYAGLYRRLLAAAATPF